MIKEKSMNMILFKKKMKQNESLSQFANYPKM